MIDREEASLLRNINDRVQKNSIESTTVTNIVSRFKMIFEELDYSDDLNTQIPVLVFDELMGVSPFFRFDYGRIDYDYLGDVGGMDDVEVGV